MDKKIKKLIKNMESSFHNRMRIAIEYKIIYGIDIFPTNEDRQLAKQKAFNYFLKYEKVKPEQYFLDKIVKKRIKTQMDSIKLLTRDGLFIKEK